MLSAMLLFTLSTSFILGICIQKFRYVPNVSTMSRCIKKNKIQTRRTVWWSMKKFILLTRILPAQITAAAKVSFSTLSTSVYLSKQPRRAHLCPWSFAKPGEKYRRLYFSFFPVSIHKGNPARRQVSVQCETRPFLNWVSGTSHDADLSRPHSCNPWSSAGITLEWVSHFSGRVRSPLHRREWSFADHKESSNG